MDFCYIFIARTTRHDIPSENNNPARIGSPLQTLRHQQHAFARTEKERTRSIFGNSRLLRFVAVSLDQLVANRPTNTRTEMKIDS